MRVLAHDVREDNMKLILLDDSNICNNRFKIKGVFRDLRGERKVKIPLRSCCCPPGDAAKGRS